MQCAVDCVLAVPIDFAYTFHDHMAPDCVQILTIDNRVALQAVLRT